MFFLWSKLWDGIMKYPSFFEESYPLGCAKHPNILKILKNLIVLAGKS